MKVALRLCVLLIILCNLAWAVDVPDPNNPDTVYLECGGVAGGVLIIKVKFVTDNVGDTNRIEAVGVPLKISNSNPSANPVIDTTPSATFAGSAVGGWESRGTFVQGNGGDPSIFPVNFGVSALTFETAKSLGPGRYFYANVIIRLQDSTTICVDTFSYLAYKLHLGKSSDNSYMPKWRGICCRVTASDLSYKPGDVNCSGGNPNLTDILYLTKYVFQGGPGPCIAKLGDVNCTGDGANISDIIYLINYVFKGGPAPLSCLK